jgi:hypothetical protein
MFKFDTNRIKMAKYNIQIDLATARLNGEIIAAGDNQVFRTIRRMTGKDVQFDKIGGLFTEKKAIKRRTSSDANIKRLNEINDLIDGFLFVPECISVITINKRDYKKLNNVDFFVNGKKFVRLLCSAGNARRNTAIFVDADIEVELKRILNCGRKDIPLVDAKYNAYFALAMTATYPVSEARIAVVDDCITHRTELVDWITERDGEDLVETCQKELEFNLFDGMGVCSVEQSMRWAEDLCIDYIPSAFCIRNAFMKGMVCTFDIHRFAKEVAKNYTFKDLYGNVVDIRNVDMVITKSQLKLWNAYESCEDYVNKTREYGFDFGISRVTPKNDKTTTTLNYQFIQATNQTKDSVPELCKKTVDWFDGLLGGSKEYLKLYMFGKACNGSIESAAELYSNTDDVISKAILLNDDLIDDLYIKRHIYRSINKKIKDSYLGKLIVDGNFQTILSDPYALMEHVFEMNVVGLLPRDKYYSSYWTNRGIDTVVGMRAPLTWQSEVNTMHIVYSEKTKDWYKYITSGIILNVHGNDCMTFSDADFDGDIILTTNESALLDNVHGGVPITYEKKNATKQIINDRSLYLSDLQAFNPKIGFITNTSSTLYTVLRLVEKKYGKNSVEYKSVINRLKICRKAQGDTIDSAKGILVKDFPKWWTQFIKITEDMSEEEKHFYNLSNKIVVDSNTRPYFFRYLYSDYNTRHENRISCFNERSIRLFGKDIYSLIESDISGENFDYLISDYSNKFGFINNDAPMNLVCHYMEKSVKRIKCERFCATDEISALLKSEKIAINKEKLKEVDDLYRKYIKEKKLFIKKSSKDFNISEKYKNIEQIFKQMRLESSKISSSSQELANLAVELCYFRNKNYDKEFVWKVFYTGLLENISENKKSGCNFPVANESGDIYYLGKTYKNMEVDLVDF